MIFISYSRDDLQLVNDLATNLAQAYGNEDVWFDTEIQGGDEWWQRILQEIMQRDVFLFVVSRESLDSEYCLKELDEATKQNKKIIPIKARRSIKEADTPLKHLQFIDMSNGISGNSLAMLRVAIDSFVSKSAIELSTQRVETFLHSSISASTKLIVVEAGPGTGKTTSLIKRIESLLRSRIDPKHILALTFTKRAVEELRYKLEMQGIPSGTDTLGTTLHSLCFRILMSNHYLLHSGRIPRPLVKFECDILLKDMVSQRFGNFYKKKRRLKALEAGWARLQIQIPDDIKDPVDREFDKQVMDWLKFHHGMLIEEVVREVIRFLRANPTSPLLSQFTHVLVDEYQDLNRADQEVVKLLAENSQLTVVGDRDQSIYVSLRYAHPEGMSELLAQVEPIRFPVTHRCPVKIAQVARTLIPGNKLVAYNEKNVGRIHCVQWDSIKDEIEGIAEFITTRVNRDGVRPGEIIVLCPRSDWGVQLTKELRGKNNIETESFFNEELLKSPASHEAFTLLKLLIDPDDRVALRCWLGINHPSVRQTEYARVRAHCEKSNFSPRETLDLMLLGDVSIPNTKGLLTRYASLRSAIERLKSISSSVEQFETLFPEKEEWAQPFHKALDSKIDDSTTIKNIHDLLLDELIHPERPSDVPFVRVTSLHGSKGIEAHLVIVMSCVQGIIPRIPDEDYSIHEEKQHEAEQRRLFYVAVTRTKHELVLSSFSRIPWNIAQQHKIPLPNSQNTVRTSDFISRDLSSILPRTVRGIDWMY